MNNIINQDTYLQKINEQYGIVELTEDLLADARTNINSKKSISFPIAELSTLGAGVSSIIPAFHTITQTTTIANEGLYRITNAVVGDTLKIAKDGQAWGAMKTAAGKSKMVKLSEAGPLTATSQAVNAFNPTTMMMATALYSIEKDLDEIKATQKKILDFLQIEKESAIEADIEALTNIVSNYKHTWDNELQVKSNHQTVNDIKIRARGSINSYRKQISNVVSSKQLIIPQSKVKSTYVELEKMFKYYKLSLYSFSLATMLEILLSGNQNSEYIAKSKDEIEILSNSYREIFETSSIYLEKLGHSELEANLVKGLGATSKAIGKAVGNIPLVKEGQVDEFLQNSGSQLQKNARDMKKKTVKQFAILNNPGTKIFINKMDDMALIYNQNNQIYFDKEYVYLMA